MAPVYGCGERGNGGEAGTALSIAKNVIQRLVPRRMTMPFTGPSDQKLMARLGRRVDIPMRLQFHELGAQYSLVEYLGYVRWEIILAADYSDLGCVERPELPNA